MSDDWRKDKLVTKKHLDDRLEDQDGLIEKRLEHHRQEIDKDSKEREKSLISEIVHQVVRQVVPQVVNKVVSKMDKRVERRFEKQEQLLVRYNGVLVENVAAEFREIAQDQLTDLKEKSNDHEERIDVLEKQAGVRM